MSDEISDLPESIWRICNNTETTGPPRIIVNSMLPIELPDEVYNYVLYVPIILAPINKWSTFILSGYENHDKLGLRIHDLRLVDKQLVSSITFTLRGNNYQLTKFKNEMARLSDADMCVGVSFFFRKLYYAGFGTIYADRKLHPKTVSPLATAFASIQNAMLGKRDE